MWAALLEHEFVVEYYSDFMYFVKVYQFYGCDFLDMFLQYNIFVSFQI